MTGFERSSAARAAFSVSAAALPSSVVTRPKAPRSLLTSDFRVSPKVRPERLQAPRGLRLGGAGGGDFAMLGHLGERPEAADRQNVVRPEVGRGDILGERLQRRGGRLAGRRERALAGAGEEVREVAGAVERPLQDGLTGHDAQPGVAATGEGVAGELGEAEAHVLPGAGGRLRPRHAATQRPPGLALRRPRSTVAMATTCRLSRHSVAAALGDVSSESKACPASAARRSSGQRKKGSPWFIVGVDAVKAALLNRLARPGMVRFSDDLPPEFYGQLTSERLVTKYSRGRPAARRPPARRRGGRPDRPASRRPGRGRRPWH